MAIIIAVMGGLVSLDQLTSLVNIGTLFAFMLVSFGIIPLRKRKDIGNRGGFKVPLYPVLPILSGLACLGMMTQLQKKHTLEQRFGLESELSSTSFTATGTVS